MVGVALRGEGMGGAAVYVTSSVAAVVALDGEEDGEGEGDRGAVVCVVCKQVWWVGCV